MVPRGRKALSEEERPQTWRERLAALRYLPALLGLVWATHRGYTATMIGLRLLRAFVPVASLWVAKLIIDVVVALTVAPGATGASLTPLWRIVAMEPGKEWEARQALLRKSIVAGPSRPS